MQTFNEIDRAAIGASSAGSSRVAIVRDFREERWHSMDLVADMLAENLRRSYPAEFPMECLCPPFRQYVGKVWHGNANQAPSIADRILNRFHNYPAWLGKRSREFALFHVVDHSYAHLTHRLPPERTVVTCHDIDAFRCLLDDARSLRSAVLKPLARRILSGLRRVAHVACVSEFTRKELLQRDWLSPDKTSVVRLGVDPAFSPEADPVVDRAFAGYVPDLGSPMILHVGSTIPRKRIDVLLRAFARVKAAAPNAVLVRVGGEFTPAQNEICRALAIQDSVMQVPFLDRGALAAAYRRASLVLLPSESEGFGLPLVEAMACGTPVVASDLPVLHETGGNVALYAPVADVDAFADAALQLVREARQAPLRRRRRRQACMLQSQNFSWTKYTAQMVEIYRRVLSEARTAGAPAGVSA